VLHQAEHVSLGFGHADGHTLVVVVPLAGTPASRYRQLARGA